MIPEIKENIQYLQEKLQVQETVIVQLQQDLQELRNQLQVDRIPQESISKAAR